LCCGTGPLQDDCPQKGCNERKEKQNHLRSPIEVTLEICLLTTEGICPSLLLTLSRNAGSGEQSDMTGRVQVENVTGV
jgi:hypothetical protein